MSKHIERAALITGGSGGIGRALADVFAKHGHDIILVARNEEKLDIAKRELEEQYNIVCETMVLDLSKQDSAYQLYRSLAVNNWIIDVLVNNAGFGTWGEFFEIAPTRIVEEMNLNVVSLTLLTNLVLKDMIQRRSGKIMNVASTAAYQPGPMMAVYYATKAYVLSFSEALAKEVEGTAVTITTLCPGPTETGFQGNAGMGKAHLFKKAFLMDAMTVAESAYEGLMKGKRVVIPGIMNTIVSTIVKFLPKTLVLSMVAVLHKRRK